MAFLREPKVKYDANKIIGTYRLVPGFDCEALNKLIEVSGVLEPEYVPFLEEHRMNLLRQGAYWNVAELKMNFLAYIMFCARLSEPGKIQVFYERLLSAELEDGRQTVKCDCLVARPFGVYEPQVPCQSRSYDATDMNDLTQIIFILRQLRHLILTELMD